MNPTDSSTIKTAITLVVSGAAGLALVAIAPAQDSNIDAAKKLAYAANTGWVNFRPSAGDGVVVTETFLSGFAYAANTGWIHLGDGAPANGHTYANASATDYGVNHDGAGNLSGLAYSANTGWVNFGWASASDPNRPRIDLLTGAFAGFAYGANTGWLNLGSGQLETDTIVCIDGDNDGIADAWERQRFGNLTTVSATTDHDRDGVSDLEEYYGASDPNSPGSFSRILSQTTNAAKTQTELQFTSQPSRVYRVYCSENLVHWVESGLGLVAPSPGSETTVVVTHPAGPSLFFRARALKPLQP